MGLVLGFALYRKYTGTAAESGVSPDTGSSALYSGTQLSQLLRVVIAVLINQCVFSLLLNTMWISLVYGSSFTGLLATRALQAVVTAPIQIIIISVLQGIMKRADIRSVLAL
jgi:ECF transporter S component (folate family)